MAWDYIIVGAGSAGCVLAHRLSAERKNKVLLLEGGGFDTSPVLRVPAGEIKAILNPRFNWMYMSEPDPSLNGRDAMWPGGKVLGGSSSINGMIYLRGQHEDYDGWARLIGNTGAWSYRDVLPYFKRMESNPLGPSEYHGADGPLRVSDVPTPHPLGRVFVEAAKELGIPFNADVNGERQEGAGPNQGTVRFGRRNSTARAYLRPVMGRRNLDVETEARVDKVLFEEGRARAVVYSRAGVTHEARADGEIILSAGAIASPAILLRSGIGPAADLSQFGIPVVADSPGVGNNLQEHPAAWVAGYVDISTYNTEVTPSGYVRHGLDWLLRGKGPAASPIAQQVAFVRTRPEEEDRPDIQIHFVPTGYEFGPDGIKLLERPGVTLPVNVCRPKSRSRLTLRSADPERAAAHLLEPLGRRGRHAADDRRLQDFAGDLREQGLQAALQGALPARARGPERRGARSLHPAIHAARLSPHQHLHDGHRRHGGRRPGAPGPWHRRAPRNRRLDHADRDQLQHQRAHHHDRREGIGSGPRRLGPVGPHFSPGSGSLLAQLPGPWCDAACRASAPGSRNAAIMLPRPNLWDAPATLSRGIPLIPLNPTLSRQIPLQY